MSTILVVDDVALAREAVAKLLEHEGFSVLRAQHGRDAWAMMYDHTPDLVLLDLMMPEMDGFEFLAELRQVPAYQQIPVVVLTSKDLTSEERSLLSGKVERILQKGMYSREALLKEVKKIVDDCALRRASGGACEEAAAVNIRDGGTGGGATVPLTDTYPAESAAANP